MNLQDIVTKAAPMTAAAVTTLTPIARGQDTVEIVHSRMLLENAPAVAFEDHETAGPVVVVGSGDMYNATTLGFIGTEPWAINRTGLEVGPVDSFSVNTEYDEFIQRFTAIVYKTQGPKFYGLRDFMSTAESVGGLLGPTDTHLLVFGMDAPNEKEKAALIHVDDDNFQHSTVEFFDAPKLYAGAVGGTPLVDGSGTPFGVFRMHAVEGVLMDTLVLDPSNMDLHNVVATHTIEGTEIPVTGITTYDRNVWGVDAGNFLGRGRIQLNYGRATIVDTFDEFTFPEYVVSLDSTFVRIGGGGTNNTRNLFALGSPLGNPGDHSNLIAQGGADTHAGRWYGLAGGIHDENGHLASRDLLLNAA